MSGRKRYQAGTRRELRLFEMVAGRVKLNPLADWTAAELAAEHRRRGLPAHPLAALGYASVGCAPCTRPVGVGEDSRAGRWARTGKTACGIHQPSTACRAAAHLSYDGGA